RTLKLDEIGDLARLDPEAIERVQKETAPLVRDADELHDTLLTLNAWPARDGKQWDLWFEELIAQGRAARVQREKKPELWIAAERWPLVQAALPDAQAIPSVDLPAELMASVDASQAVLNLVRGRVEVSGPVTAKKISDDLGLELLGVESALARLE